MSGPSPVSKDDSTETLGPTGMGELDQRLCQRNPLSLRTHAFRLVGVNGSSAPVLDGTVGNFYTNSAPWRIVRFLWVGIWLLVAN